MRPDYNYQDSVTIIVYDNNGTQLKQLRGKPRYYYNGIFPTTDNNYVLIEHDTTISQLYLSDGTESTVSGAYRIAAISPDAKHYLLRQVYGSGGPYTMLWLATWTNGLIHLERSWSALSESFPDLEWIDNSRFTISLYDSLNLRYLAIIDTNFKEVFRDTTILSREDNFPRVAVQGDSTDLFYFDPYNGSGIVNFHKFNIATRSDSILFTNQYSSGFYLSHDGKMILYNSYVNNTSNLVASNVQTGNQQVLGAIPYSSIGLSPVDYHYAYIENEHTNPTLKIINVALP